MRITVETLLERRVAALDCEGLVVFQALYPEGLEWGPAAALELVRGPLRWWLGTACLGMGLDLDLRQAALAGPLLPRCTIYASFLGHAGLIECGLAGADLRNADLSGTDLRGADLRWANLEWAVLTGADFYQADLRWANLSGARFRGANLRGALRLETDLPIPGWVVRRNRLEQGES